MSASTFQWKLLLTKDVLEDLSVTCMQCLTCFWSFLSWNCVLQNEEANECDVCQRQVWITLCSLFADFCRVVREKVWSFLTVSTFFVSKTSWMSCNLQLIASTRHLKLTTNPLPWARLTWWHQAHGENKLVTTNTCMLQLGGHGADAKSMIFLVCRASFHTRILSLPPVSFVSCFGPSLLRKMRKHDRTNCLFFPFRWETWLESDKIWTSFAIKKEKENKVWHEMWMKTPLNNRWSWQGCPLPVPFALLHDWFAKCRHPSVTHWVNASFIVRCLLLETICQSAHLILRRHWSFPAMLSFLQPELLQMNANNTAVKNPFMKFAKIPFLCALCTCQCCACMVFLSLFQQCCWLLRSALNSAPGPCGSTVLLHKILKCSTLNYMPELDW